MNSTAKPRAPRIIRSTRDCVQSDAFAHHRHLLPIAHRIHDPALWSNSARPSAIGISCAFPQSLRSNCKKGALGALRLLAWLQPAPAFRLLLVPARVLQTSPRP
jgi:hypothetical protein